MSGVEDGGPHRLVAELATTPGAVPALVALHDGAGSATGETLRQACGGGDRSDTAVRWLTDVGLARPVAVGEVGDSSPTYELTDVGRALTRALIDLAQALAEPVIDKT